MARKIQKTQSMPKGELERTLFAWAGSTIMSLKQVSGLPEGAGGGWWLSGEKKNIQHLPQSALLLLSLEEPICTETQLSSPCNCKTPSSVGPHRDAFHSPALAGPGCVRGQVISLSPPRE